MRHPVEQKPGWHTKGDSGVSGAALPNAAPHRLALTTKYWYFRKELKMEHWIKYAYLDGEHERMMGEAAKSRLLRKLKDDPEGDSLPFKRGRGTTIARKLLYVAWIVLLLALWLVSVAQAAGGGGGGRYLVM
jgi:hypothetical protein